MIEAFGRSIGARVCVCLDRSTIDRIQSRIRIAALGVAQWLRTPKKEAAYEYATSATTR